MGIVQRSAAKAWAPMLAGLIGSAITLLALGGSALEDYVSKSVASHPDIVLLRQDVITVKEDVAWIRGYLKQQKESQR